MLLTLLLATRLSTGAMLDPIASPHKVGNFPLAMLPSPDGNQLVLLLNGWRQQGIQVVDRASGDVLQTIEQPAAFLGLTFAPDGRTLYASGGNDDVIHVYRWEGGRAAADGTIALRAPKKNPKDSGTAYPAGLTFSPDGRFLYAAENLGDTIAVIDVAERAVVQHVVTDRYPYAVVADRNHLYVSCWGDSTVNAFARGQNGLLSERSRIAAGRHPSALLLSGSRLYATSATTDTISVINTTTSKKVNMFTDSPPSGPREGSTPNALAMSRDGKRLFVAEADNNAVAVFEVATGKLLGRVPTEWYPAALARVGSTIFVASAKGAGSAPDPGRVQPGATPPKARDYTLGQLDGSVLSFPENVGDLASLSRRVATANGWDTKRTAAKYPPFKHVIYIIKENRTYDQVFGDMPEGDGDRSLVYFGESNSPNHHALAKRFGLFDRFFVNAEVSADGHTWSMAAYISDYAGKTVPSQYSSRGRTYDYAGENRERIVNDDDDVNSPSTGYLWDLAVRKKISFRDYGEFTVKGAEAGMGTRTVGTKSALLTAVSPDYIGWDLDVSDQKRVDAWLAEFNRYVAEGNLPAFEIMSLPNDHTSGLTHNKPTPRAYMADNDLAFGRVVEAVSKSPFWCDTVIFVLEDDAQSGPDHVDSHRSVFLAISAYSRAGVVHRFTNTTDVLATIEEILGLDSLSQFDHFGRPLRGIFSSQPDLTPYAAITPNIDMNEKNPPGPERPEVGMLDFSRPDAVDDETFNRILWQAIKGDGVPYPDAKRAPTAVGN
ncbi:MAG TPA: alkaline phosphatase family protein [Thermoanaerobaculia bacterium]|nr:alkaline phosphatase family protein [Thermoanaerobaculia bacterium]